eukprot:Nitzschia sp. Nitz4//scaffold36_size144017//6019//7186//NITZ4_003064-RA/size144017-processed-gene-0.64-mRNA-1//-1//CDS//3329549390//5211//frame0
MTKDTKDSKDTKPTNPSFSNVHLALMAALLLGIGTMGGYGIFSSIYAHRCADLLDDAERQFNTTRQQLQNQLIDTQHDESRVLELKSQLEGHNSDWMAKHQALLDKHQAAMDQLAKSQQQHDEVRQRAIKLEKDLEQETTRVKELEKTVNVASVQRRGLEQRLEEAAQKIQDAQDVQPCEDTSSEAMEHIRQLHMGVAKHVYGTGPYYMEFQVQFDSEEQTSFIVEVDTLESLPHSVFSFLTLADLGVYEQAEFLPTQSILHIDSNEGIIQPFAMSALQLVEKEGHACSPYSVGFVGATGGLKIVMTNNVEKQGTLACFGKVAQGRQAISRIQRAGKEGKQVMVRLAKLVNLEERPTLREGEL